MSATGVAVIDKVEEAFLSLFKGEARAQVQAIGFEKCARLACRVLGEFAAQLKKVDLGIHQTGADSSRILSEAAGGVEYTLYTRSKPFLATYLHAEAFRELKYEPLEDMAFEIFYASVSQEEVARHIVSGYSIARLAVEMGLCPAVLEQHGDLTADPIWLQSRYNSLERARLHCSCDSCALIAGRVDPRQTAGFLVALNPECDILPLIRLDRTAFPEAVDHAIRRLMSVRRDTSLLKEHSQELKFVLLEYLDLCEEIKGAAAMAAHCYHHGQYARQAEAERWMAPRYRRLRVLDEALLEDFWETPPLDYVRSWLKQRQTLTKDNFLHGLALAKILWDYKNYKVPSLTW